MSTLLISVIALPLCASILALVLPERARPVKNALFAAISLAALVIAVALFGREYSFTLPWAGYGIEFSLRLYHFSGFIVLAASAFTFLIVLYSLVFMSGRPSFGPFFAYLFLSTAMVAGAALADNLIVLLFFWEGLLLPLFGMIYIGGRTAYKTAVKAFIIVGITDLCMMFGIGLTAYLSKTLTISAIHLPLDRYGSVAFIAIMIGAISKAGSMPFHSWIPDAALDAPLPFMAFLPAALEKLIGIYLLARISLDIFALTPGVGVSMLLMIIGVLTILVAVLLALVQKDYKRLLSYHAISQVGYMVLGIGTAVPAGIVGGLFHMINHAMYKSCLFLTGGSVEKQAGTTDLKKLGGLGRQMPVTFACFIVAAAAISGVPPLNGFFSKELVYDGALERGWIFYVCALAGSFLTAASFLKLGHSAYLGQSTPETRNAKESPALMLFPMITIAAFCIFFGVFNAVPLNGLIEPILGARLEGRQFAGFPANAFLIVATVVVLVAAYLNHRYGVKRTGSGLGAADHMYHAPVMSSFYAISEKKDADPYNAGMDLAGLLSKIFWYIDRAIDWCYNVLAVRAAYGASAGIRALQNGSYSRYILWSVVGTLVVALLLI